MDQLHTGYGPLMQVMRQKIAASEQLGISFYDYMALCLYEKKHGYYMRNNEKIGKDGDFYTSASIGNVMGKMLARFIVKTWAKLGEQSFRIEEWGGGDGTLACQVLNELKEHAFDVYEALEWVAIETSSYHRQLQQDKLFAHTDRITWFNQAPSHRSEKPTLVLANELLDAFPVYRIKNKHGELLESIVRWSEQIGFYEQFVTIYSKRLIQLKNERQWSSHLAPGQITEVNLDALEWFTNLGNRFSQAVVLVIDYGDVEQELYARHRMTGTLMCYRRHVAHDNPFIYVGEQDMTTQVNFTACMRASVDAGFQNVSYRTQKQFLIDEGVMELLTDHDSSDPFSAAATMNRAVRQLLLGAQMSERFKVFTMEKGQL